VIMHSGLTRDPASGEMLGEDRVSGENAVGRLAATVPGIDVILYGHTHQELSGKTINGVLLAQAKYWGRSLAEADVEMEQSADGAWRVTAKTSRTIPVTAEVAADARITALAKPYHEGSEAWLAERVTRTEVEQSAELARVEGDALFSLIHGAQLEAGRADVSLATVSNTHVHFPAGAVTVRDLYALYPYENTLFTVEMTGAQLKEVLEHAASYYPAWPAKEGQHLRLPGYEVDTAEGVSYVIDLTQPAGLRIRALTFQDKPLEPGRKLRVAVNDYRYYGGGEYAMLRHLPILRRSTAGIRELVIDFARAKTQIPGSGKTNWRIEPREAREALRTEALR
jgi:2',3'-cyclic-nucleotide 2'-phosphodiesterase (5'-nucleotidase family)